MPRYLQWDTAGFCFGPIDNEGDWNMMFLCLKTLSIGKRQAENDAITLNGTQFSSVKWLVINFNQQLNTSKLGRHTFSSKTQLVSSDIKRKPLEMAPQIITAYLEMRALKSCKVVRPLR